MLNYTKSRYFKIITLTVAVTLFFESIVYGTSLSDLKQLRVPLSGTARIREVKDDVPWWKEGTGKKSLDICVGGTPYHEIGGLTSYIKTLYTEIAKIENIRIHLVYFEKDRANHSSVIRCGKGEIVFHPIYIYPSILLIGSMSKRMFDVIRELREIRRKEDIDLLHLHLPSIPPMAIPYILFHLVRNIPLVSTSHSTLGALTWKKIVKLVFLKFMGPLLGERFAVSEASAKALGKKAGVIGSLVDTFYYDPQKAEPEKFLEQYTLRKDECIIFYPSRIIPEKGQADLIRVARYIREEKPDLKFKVIMAGPVLNPRDKVYLEEIKHIIPDDLEDYITILPPLIGDELRNAYASADIVVVSSHYEALCLVILEALSMKKPVVANKVGGIPEVVVEGETGFLVEPHKPEEMADRIIKLLEDPAERIRLGENGRNFVLEKYSVENGVRRHFDLYFRLTNKELRTGI